MTLHHLLACVVCADGSVHGLLQTVLSTGLTDGRTRVWGRASTTRGACTSTSAYACAVGVSVVIQTSLDQLKYEKKSLSQRHGEAKRRFERRGAFPEGGEGGTGAYNPDVQALRIKWPKLVRPQIALFHESRTRFNVSAPACVGARQSAEASGGRREIKEGPREDKEQDGSNDNFWSERRRLVEDWEEYDEVSGRRCTAVATAAAAVALRGVLADLESWLSREVMRRSTLQGSSVASGYLRLVTGWCLTVVVASHQIRLDPIGS